ncbi:MAG TPA: hypothetical protein VFP31_02530 [Gaiellaceae bacterium]|nr:hypothetical protein [Gaiellaceae bacterium]
MQARQQIRRLTAFPLQRASSQPELVAWNEARCGGERPVGAIQGEFPAEREWVEVARRPG